MLVLLAWLACAPSTPEGRPHVEPPGDPGALGAAQVTTPSIATRLTAAPEGPPARRGDVSLPAGEAVVDEGCYGGARLQPRPKPRPAATGSRREGGEQAASKPHGGRFASAEGAGAPTADADPDGMQDLGGLVGGAEPAPQAAPPPAAAIADRPSDRAPDLGGDATAEAQRQAVGSLGNEARNRAAEEKTSSSFDEEVADATAARRAPTEPTPERDWGATVYLSNDDSMSLASAQRLLWTVGRGQVPSVDEVRPHELLNYFSFDTSPVPEGQTFSVLGAAEQDGDTVSLALAVKGALPERRPLDLTLVVDRSGSMSAEGRMAYTKRGLDRMADELEPGDRVDLVLFDDRVCTPLRDFVVGRDDPALLERAIALLEPRGATDLDAGLRAAYALQTSRTEAEVHGRNRRLVVVTDAELNAGNVNESLVAEVGKNLDEHGIRLAGVGVGTTFNDGMLNKLTERGKGAYVYLGSEAVVDRVFGPGFRSLTETLAHDVHFALDMPDSLAMERFHGEEASTNIADVQPIHYYAGTTQLFLQDLKVREGRVVAADPVGLTITWRDAVTDEPAELRLSTTVGALLDGDARNVHKAQALTAWADLAIARGLGADACGEPLRAFADRAGAVADDAEIAYVRTLAGNLCPGASLAPRPAGVAYKVKVDADTAISEIDLACDGGRQTAALSGSDTVARFDGARPGACTLTLHGAVPMAAPVEVPSTGGDVRCLVRGGRVTCG